MIIDLNTLPDWPWVECASAWPSFTSSTSASPPPGAAGSEKTRIIINETEK